MKSFINMERNQLIEDADTDRPVQVDLIELTDTVTKKFQHFSRTENLSFAHNKLREVLTRSLRIHPYAPWNKRILYSQAWYLSNYSYVIILIRGRAITCFPLTLRNSYYWQIQNLPQRLERTYGPNPLIEKIQPGWVQLTPEQGNVLYEARVREKIRVTEIIELLGIGQDNFKGFEVGYLPITGQRLLILLRKLNLSVDHLRLMGSEIFEQMPAPVKKRA